MTDLIADILTLTLAVILGPIIFIARALYQVSIFFFGEN